MQIVVWCPVKTMQTKTVGVIVQWR